MRQLVLEPTAAAQWLSLVNEAEAACDQQLTEDLQSYLVFLLMRFATEPDVAARVMALDYLESHQANGRLREEQLRQVGDHCLLYSGLYPQRAASKLVRVSYFVDLGRSAYHDLAESLVRGSASLYRQLSDGFVNLTDVLLAMRGLNGEIPLQPLEAAELWSDTGSRGARYNLCAATDGGSIVALDPQGKQKQPH